MDVPLIYTSKGNLPIADLDYNHFWHEDEASIVLIEEYRLNGEVVKRSAHHKLKHGLDANLEQQIFGV